MSYSWISFFCFSIAKVVTPTEVGSPVEKKVVTRNHRSKVKALDTKIEYLKLEIGRDHFRYTFQEAAERIGISTTAFER